MPVQRIDKNPVLEKLLFGNFSNIEGNSNLVHSEGILEKLQVETVVILIFGIGIEAIDGDGPGKEMIHDSTIDDTITKVFDFHFGVGVWYDLFDPVEDGGLAGHGAGCARFLYHECDINEVFG